MAGAVGVVSARDRFYDLLMERYVLCGGRAGYDRRRVLAAARRARTLELFQLAGLRPGMRCVDLGCGSGDVTLDMAALARPVGWAAGIDADQAKLELAREGFSRSGRAAALTTPPLSHSGKAMPASNPEHGTPGACHSCDSSSIWLAPAGPFCAKLGAAAMAAFRRISGRHLRASRFALARGSAGCGNPARRPAGSADHNGRDAARFCVRCGVTVTTRAWRLRRAAGVIAAVAAAGLAGCSSGPDTAASSHPLAPVVTPAPPAAPSVVASGCSTWVTGRDSAAALVHVRTTLSVTGARAPQAGVAGRVTVSSIDVVFLAGRAPVGWAIQATSRGNAAIVTGNGKVVLTAIADGIYLSGRWAPQCRVVRVYWLPGDHG